MKEVHHHNLCKAENGDVRQRRGAQISYSSLFSIRIDDTFCQLKSTLIYNNISRALVYTWHGRFSDRNTVNTSLGWPKYKNCSIVKIDCDYRRTIREVAGMASISKYTAQHTITSDLSMSHVNAR